ncbi:MAG: glycogen/starch/alpha-glucan phosphorylase, partial [Christensenellales bacterium]
MSKTAERKRQIIDGIKANLLNLFGKTVKTANKTQIYLACALVAREDIMARWVKTKELEARHEGKKLYYLSVEFLPGRAMSNNLLALGESRLYAESLLELGVSINEIEDTEADPGLGNGGLGRLASCFLDSLATLNYPAMGCGIRYEYGLFRQRIIDNAQVEIPDTWLDDMGGYPWETCVVEDVFPVRFGGTIHEEYEDGILKVHHTGYSVVNAVPYDLPILGYGTENVGTLRLWSARSPKLLDMDIFSKGDYIRAVEDKELAEVISKVLYPCENHREGKSLRLKQHYFFTSATIQYIVREHKKRYGSLYNLADKVCIQINDTHPALAIPELLRIMIDEEGMEWDVACNICTKVFGYTNHTVMSEALEKWPEGLFKELLPRIYAIIRGINEDYCRKLWQFYPGQWERIGSMAVIGYHEIRMANLCVAMSNHVNGVSRLHGEILKQDVFRNFFMVEPWKFTSVTNGITPRRWLQNANPALCALLDDAIGEDYKQDLAALSRLEPLADDPAFLQRFAEVKQANKRRFADWLKKKQGIEIDPSTVFDVQSKRAHEYKRQLMNLLHIISLYDRLLNDPDFDMTPTTFLFAAKAPANYTMAKHIIKLANVLSQKIADAPARVKERLNVVFVENYNVTVAELLIPAADVSQQISTAGKEASGTGNMKFMLNGAITIGTLDGANVEMKEQVGDENIFIFGLTAKEVERLHRFGKYSAGKMYETSPTIRRAMDYLINGELDLTGTRVFNDLHHVLLFGEN